MIEVSKEKFQEVIKKRPYSTSLVIGEEDTLRYNGKKGLFKGSCFAMKVKDTYFINKAFL